MEFGITAFVVIALGVCLIAFMKGAFGGGFAIIGIPLLSLVMDPIAAGALLAPMFIAMDMFALRYWKPNTWSKPDLLLLVPGLVVGVGVGYATLSVLDHRAVSIAMALITLVFTGLWLKGGGKVTEKPMDPAKAVVAGAGAGITTMIAHAGGPPLAIYLLPRGLTKQVYAGTTSLFFTFANALKVGPWLLLSPPSRSTWITMALCLPAVPVGVWAGWHFHQRLDQKQVYRMCYGLLVITAIKLLWDGVAGYL